MSDPKIFMPFGYTKKCPWCGSDKIIKSYSPTPPNLVPHLNVKCGSCDVGLPREVCKNYPATYEQYKNSTRKQKHFELYNKKETKNG